jgi:cellobiose phosphorylase
MVLGGVASPERAIQAMNSAREYLDTPKGPKILHPAYTVIDPGIGLATRCVPGKKENGAVFNHAASWAILAELYLRRADQAFDYYQKTWPFNPVVKPERYAMEPYVYAEYVTSPDHPTFGQASHSWLTGSAVWMLKNVTEYILGVRAAFEGLVVDPCVPTGWKQFQVQRKCRGATYRIDVSIPKGKGGKVQEIVANGAKVEGTVIPASPAGETVHVKVKVG